LEWWADKRGQEGEGMKTVRERCRVLVEWLEQAEEEESEEEEEESEEDEE
jgi:translation initiation factor eIF-2B subunit epsilon